MTDNSRVLLLSRYGVIIIHTVAVWHALWGLLHSNQNCIRTGNTQNLDSAFIHTCNVWLNNLLNGQFIRLMGYALGPTKQESIACHMYKMKWTLLRLTISKCRTSLLAKNIFFPQRGAFTEQAATYRSSFFTCILRICSCRPSPPWLLQRGYDFQLPCLFTMVVYSLPSLIACKCAVIS